MSKKFEAAKKQLNQYRDEFYKSKNSLQQDHDSFVKIKDQTEKELKEQISIQSKREVSVNEALQQKADLRLGVDDGGWGLWNQSRDAADVQSLAAVTSFSDFMSDDAADAKETAGKGSETHNLYSRRTQELAEAQ